MDSAPNKVQLKQRWRDAIANSKAIANLADHNNEDNPEPQAGITLRSRRLYDQASRGLLSHWDVNHQRWQIPLDAIG